MFKLNIRFLQTLLLLLAISTQSVSYAAVSQFNDGIAVGGTTLSTGLAVDVTGKIGATEYCDQNGNGCVNISKIVSGDSNSGAVTAGNWYRIASNPGNRAHARFILTDTISGGGHSTLVFEAGTNYNSANGMSFTVVAHSMYNIATFTKVRILQKTTYDPQYLEVYINRSGNVKYHMFDNLQSYGWTPLDWTAGAIPSGYTAHEYDTNNVFVVGSSDDAFTVARNRNVGIGAPVPAEQLHIQDTAPNIQLTDTDTGADSYILANSGTGGLIVAADQNNEVAGSYLGLNVDGGTEKMRILANGNVGIGTTAPGVKLDVNGDVKANNLLIYRGGIGATDVAVGSTTGWPNNPLPGAYITDYVGSTGTVLMTNDVPGSTASVGLEFKYSGDIFYHSNTDSNQWRSYKVVAANTAGNVGIGTTAPSTGLKLDIAGRVGATEYCDQNGANCTAAAALGSGYWSKTGTDVWYNPGAVGEVGIGLSNPSEELVVNRSQDNAPTTIAVQNTNTGTGTNTRAGVALQSNGNTVDLMTYGTGATGSIGGVPRADSAFLRTATSNPVNTLNIGTGGAQDVNLFTNDTTRVTVDGATGNVGIGATTPVLYGGYTSLTLGGASGKEGLLKFAGSYNSGNGAEFFQDASGNVALNLNSSTRAMTVNTAGNVGIGTTSPGRKLDIVGSARISDKLYTSKIGRGAYGIYDPLRYQHVWSMGDAYNLPADGLDETGAAGNLYGLAWSYNPNYSYAGSNPQAKPGLNHQLLLMMNGITKTAIGEGLWTSGNITLGGTRALHFGTGDQRIYGDDSSALYAESNHSTVTQMILRDKENTIYGRVYGDGNGANFGLLDGDANWGIQMAKDSYTRFLINNSEKMRILANGNVGIATTAPQARLSIGNNTGSQLFNADGQYSDVIYEGTSGGTEAGVWNFINTGTWNQTRFYVEDANNALSRLTFDFRGNGGLTKILAGTSSGNVGIGTTTPAANLKLNVTGRVGATEYCDANGANCTAAAALGSGYWSKTGTDVWYNPGAVGEVGIGLSNPSEELTVNRAQTSPTTIAVQNSSAGASTTVRAGLTVQSNGATSDFVTYGTGATGSWGGQTVADATMIRNYSTAPSSKMLVGTGGNVPLHLATNNATRVTVTGNGNVGIGTTNPSSILDIVGTSATTDGLEVLSSPSLGQAHTQIITGNSSADRAFRVINSQPTSGVRYTHLTHNLDYDGSVYTQGNWSGSSAIEFKSGDLYFLADSSVVSGSQSVITPTTRLVIRTNGSVGIGTTAPTEELHVFKSQANPTTIVSGNTSTSTNTNTRAGFAAAANGGQLDVMHYGSAATGSLGGQTKADAAYIRTSSGSPSSKMVIGNGGNAPVHFITSDTTRMTVLGGGNVGIGTTTPNETLEVVTVPTTNKGVKITSGTIGAMSIGGVNNENANGYVRNAILMSRDGDLSWDSTNDLWKKPNGGSNDFSAILHRSTELGFVVGGADDLSGGMTNTNFLNTYERLTLESSGEIGMGTVNPTEELHVFKSQANPTTIVSGNTSTSTNTNTRAGFAAAANGGQLDVMQYGSAATGSLSGQTKADAAFIRTSSGAPSSKMVIGNGGNAPVHLITNDTTRMTVLGNGNVGIGTTAPGVKLDVNGDVKANNLLIYRGSLGSTNTTVGSTTGWPNNPLPGAYMTDYVGSTGTVLMTNDVPGSTASVGLEFKYNGEIFYHSNTDSNQWRSYKVVAANTAGNVGIGTTTPAANLKLNVTGRVGATEYCDANGANCTAAAALGSGYWSKTGTDVWYNPGAVGEVGIGLSNPTEELVVNRSANNAPTTIAVQNSNTGTGTNTRAGFTASSNGAQLDMMAYSSGATGTIGGTNKADGAFIRTGTTLAPSSLNVGTGGAQDLKLFTADTTRVTVDGATGNVGIGTTNPAAKLELSRTLANNDWKAFEISNKGSWSTAQGKYAQMMFTDGNNNVAGIGATYEGGYGRIDFNGFYSGGSGSAAVAVMSIKGNGNVGIGTTNPAAKLDVNGNLRVTTPGGAWISGKTGTGGLTSSTPQTVSSYHPMIRQTTSSGHVINLGGLGDDFGFFGYDAARTANGYDYNLTMDLGNGNVGIGTTSPAYPLDVVGSARVSDKLFSGNYGRGVYGIYSPLRYEHVWGMGNSYNLPANGLDETGAAGNFYGLAWSYNPNYSYAGSNPQAKPGLNHQLLLMMNGITKTAIGEGLWTSGNITLGGTRALHFGTGDQRIYGDDSSALYAESNHSTVTQMILRDKENTIYGRVYGDGNGANFGLLDGDANWGIQMAKDSYTRFLINNSEKMRILANGNVGIGDTTPDGTLKLDVNGQIGATEYCDQNGANCTAAAALGSGYWSKTGTDVWYNPGAVGEVGIGLSNPSEELTVNRAQTSPTTIAVQNSSAGASTTVRAGLTVQSNGATSDFVTYGTGATGSWGGQTVADATMIRNYSTAPSSKMLVGTGGNVPLYLATNNATRVTVTGSGNVGIGTTAPTLGDIGGAPKVHINGGTSSGTYEDVLRVQAGSDADNTGAAIVINHSNDRGLRIKAGRQIGNIGQAMFSILDNLGAETDVMTLLQSGNVGIGTTSPITRLQIGDGTTNGGNVITFGKRATSAETNLPKIGHDSFNGVASDLALSANSGSGGINFYTGNNSAGFGAGINDLRMRINASGNVGIGTTNPSAKLEVTGGQVLSSDNANVNGSNFVVNTTNKDTALYAYDVQRSGSTVAGIKIGGGGYFANSVGIGTTTPQGLLDVEGIASVGGYNDISPSNSASGQLVIKGAGYTGFVAMDGTAMNIGHNSSARLLNLLVNESTKLSINNTGNVGIGTTSPNAKLDVAGALVYGTGALQPGFDSYDLTASNTTFAPLTFGGVSLNTQLIYEVTLNTRSTGSNAAYAGVVWYNSDTASWNIRDVSYQYKSSNWPWLVLDGGVVKVRTGHTSTYPIAVTIIAKEADDDNSVYAFGAGAMWQRISTNLAYMDGNIGIGVTTPLEKLHLAGSATNLQLTDTDTGADTMLLTNSSVGGAILSADQNNEVGNSYLGFNVDGTERGRFDSTGAFMFSGNIRRSSGQLKCPTGQVMVGFNTAGLMCEDPTIYYN